MASQHSPHPPDLRTDQLAPHSVEAEEAVLGSILINPEVLFEVIAFLVPESFFIVRHAWIYDAIRSLHDRRDPIDYLMVVHELEQRGQLAEIGGAAYVLSLINKTPSALNVEGYGKIVERMAVRRRLIEAASQVARVAHSDETEIERVIALSEQAIFEITQQRDKSAIRSLKALASEHYDRTMSTLRRGEVEGIKTYIRDLDKVLVALRPGDLILIAGRPGMGKSSFLESIAAENARRGVPVGMLSMEMSDEQITTRFIAAECEVAYQRLDDAKLDEKEWQRYMDAVGAVSTWPLVIDDTAALTPLDVRTKLRRMVFEHNIQLGMVDYVQLMRGGPGYVGADSREREISYISRSLKQIARELNIPILAAAQLSREVERRSDKRPQLHDLRESGSLEQDSDVVLFLYRDSYYHPHSSAGNVTEIHVAKHRNGPTGVVKALYLKQKMRFVDLAASQPPPLLDDSKNGVRASQVRVYGQATGERDVLDEH